MNWDEIKDNTVRNEHKVKEVLAHTQNLANFRKRHPAVGAGRHSMISESPYFFSRKYKIQNFEDMVVIGIDIPEGKVKVDVSSVFEDGTVVNEVYSGSRAEVKNGQLEVSEHSGIILLERG